MKEVLFVLGLKKNLLSISALYAKGMRVAFIDGQVIMWPRGKTINDAVVIGDVARVFALACTNEYLLRTMDSLVSVQ